jgi:hypothetical protein
VVRAGGGTGTVTSSPSGINCGTDCSESYASNTMVTLTATATGGAVFSGWSGGGCAGTGTCVVTMSSALTVTATFDLTSYTLNTIVTATGGTGAITSSPGGINCGADCTEAFATGTAVVLTPVPDGVSSFTSWSGGGCTGTGPCTVTMSNNLTVTGTFGPQRFRLTTIKAGTGNGTITSAAGGHQLRHRLHRGLQRGNDGCPDRGRQRHLELRRLERRRLHRPRPVHRHDGRGEVGDRDASTPTAIR